LVDEACYEGICGSSGADVQRYLVLSTVLTGCCGFCYGADGIWQMSSNRQPYGASPHGATWGDSFWEDSYKLPGGKHVGQIRRFFELFEWWNFQPHMEWIENPCEYETITGSFAAGIPGKVRVIYTPLFSFDFGGQNLVKNIEPDITYFAYHYDPINHKLIDFGQVHPDKNGCWVSPSSSAFQDWVLVLSVEKLEL